MIRFEFLAVLACAFMGTTAAFAGDLTSVSEEERGIEWHVDSTGPEVSLVSRSREQLKGTTKTQGDFNLANRFKMEIDGVAIGGIHTIEGLEHEHEVVEYHDGDEGVTRFRPGRQKQGKIRIERDFSSTKEFFQWRKAVLDGKVERKSGSIIYLDREGKEVMRISFNDCFPTQVVYIESPLEKQSARTEVAELECLGMQVAVKNGPNSSFVIQARHDAAMAAIQNTR